MLQLKCAEYIIQFSPSTGHLQIVTFFILNCLLSCLFLYFPGLVSWMVGIAVYVYLCIGARRKLLICQTLCLLL